MFGLQKRSDGATGQAYYSPRKHFCSHFSHYFSPHVKQAPGPQTLPPLHHSAIWPISRTFAVWPLDSEVKRVWQGERETLLLLSHLICLSETHLKTQAEKQRFASLPRRASLKASVIYLSAVIWLPTHGRDSQTAWEIPSSFKALIGV